MPEPFDPLAMSTYFVSFSLLLSTKQAPSPSFIPGFSDLEPAVLTVGTEVSAKYKGAFCEAKIKSIARLVKCRVSLKGTGPSVVVTDDNINGPLRVGANVEAKHNSNLVEGTITKIMDGSQYTVIFDDGDETTLKRTSLCLKSGKHYSESESLDHLPLTNPEHFGNPVRGGRAKRKRMAAASGLASGTSTVSSLPYGSSDVDDNESAEGDTVTGSLDGDDDTASNITQQSLPKDGKDEDSRSPLPTPKSDPQQENIGSVFVIEYSEKRGNKAKDTWYPALVVSPTTTEQNSVKVDPAEEFLVKSFKDNRFYCINQKDVKPFDRVLYCSSLTDANSSAALRSAVDKCISYIQNRDLPASWDADLLLGSFLPNADDVAVGSSELDSLADEEYEQVATRKDDQPSEEKDRFVAQLYKFMDERGTPINKAPSVNGKDLDLYRLYTLVNEMGGYNKISSRDIWKSVYLKSDLHACPTDALENVAINQLKAAYKKYLLNFTDFYRKLGYSTFANSPMASRASARPARNERSWRLTGLDQAAPVKETPSAKGGRRRKSATETDVKAEEVSQEADDSKNEGDDSSVSGRRGSLKKNAKKMMSGRRKPGPKAESSESEETAPDGIPDPGPNIDSDTETDVSAVKTITKDVEVNTGDKIRVKYIKGPKEHIYEAKIIKSEKNADPAKQRFFVHYAGWNTRYDEWIKRNRIVQVIRDKTPKRRGGLKGVKRGPPPEVLEQERLEAKLLEAKLLEAGTPSKRNRGSAPITGGRLSTDSLKTAAPSTKMLKTSTGKKSRRGGDADAATESCDEILSKNEDSLASSVSYPEVSVSGKDDSVCDNEADLSDAVSSKDVKPAKTEPDEAADITCRRQSIESSSARASRSHRETSSAASHNEAKSEDQVKSAPPDRDSNDSTEEDDAVRSAPVGVHKRRKTKSARDKRDIVPEDERLSKSHALETESKKKSKSVRGRSRDELAKTESEDRRAMDRKRKLADMSPTRPEENLVEPDDEKLKRKRGFKERDARPAESSVKKSDDSPAKVKPKKEEPDRAKKEDEDVNQEIARLFDDEKTTASEAVSHPALSTTAVAAEKENAATTTDVSSTFLLCREEVPLSPVAAPAADSFDPSFDHSKPSTSADAGKDEKDAAREECKSEPGNNNFSPPTTPESLRSGTLSSLTPPHEREGQDLETGKSCNQNVSSSNSDAEANDNCASKVRPNAPTKNAFGSPPHLSDDSGCSRGAADGGHLKDLSEKQDRVAEGSATNSPKRKRRGRTRAASTSEPTAGNEAETGKKVKYGDKHAGYKTRGSSAKRSARYQEHDRYSPVGSASDQPGSHPISPVSGISLSQLPPNAFFANIQPISKYNFCTPLPEDLDSDRRIQILNDRIQELRKTYMNLKSELAAVERRKKKCKRKANGNYSGSGQEKRLLEKSMSQDLSSDASDKVPNARESSAS